jgi:hypothetical protein
VLASGVIEMGVREYVPAIGRFAQRDPIPGGSANAYDYGAADPCNKFDLSGQFIDCGSSHRYSNSVISFHIYRSRAGVTEDGHRYVIYKIHWQVRSAFALAARTSEVTSHYTTPDGSYGRGHNNSFDRRFRTSYRRDYAHTTMRVRPGTLIRYWARSTFDPIPLGGNRYLTGWHFAGGCYAR